MLSWAVKEAGCGVVVCRASSYPRYSVYWLRVGMATKALSRYRYVPTTGHRQQATSSVSRDDISCIHHE